MTLIALARHPFRRPLRCDVHLDGTFSRTRYYICRVCGEVVREENDE